MGAAGRRGGGRANAVRGSRTTTDSLPIDAAEQIAAAYQRRPPRYPVTPETVGLPIAPLANRNTSPRWPVNRAAYGTGCGLKLHTQCSTDISCRFH